jgi:hypothetical protein
MPVYVRAMLRDALGWVLACLVCWSGSALADDKADVEKLVRKQLSSFDTAMTSMSGTIEGAGGFIRAVRHSPDSYKGGNISPTFNKVSGQPSFKPGAITVVVLEDAAWFHGIGTFTMKTADKKPITETRTMRVSGIARKKDRGWIATGELFAIAVDDKALVEDVKKITFKAPTGAATLDGDKTLARTVDRWITAHEFGKSASSAPDVVASGTSPTEHKTGAAAGTLASTWDKLKLLPIEIDAKLVSPTLGFVIADVAMVMPKGPPAHVVLGAILVKEKETWKWVSLSWTTDEWFPKPEFQEPAPTDPCGD